VDDVKVVMHGIRELSGALRRVDARLPGEIRAEFRGVADQVAAKVASKVPRRSGRAAASVKGRASGRNASIVAGGRAAPHFPWLDFGGSVGRGHRPRVPWSGAIRRDWRGKPGGEGRYIYPTIREERDEIIEGADQAVERVLRKVGV
jgi:hypothetical protein